MTRNRKQPEILASGKWCANRRKSSREFKRSFARRSDCVQCLIKQIQPGSDSIWTLVQSTFHSIGVDTRNLTGNNTSSLQNKFGLLHLKMFRVRRLESVISPLTSRWDVSTFLSGVKWLGRSRLYWWRMIFQGKLGELQVYALVPTSRSADRWIFHVFPSSLQLIPSADGSWSRCYTD
jgi:hypothetical protein